VTWAYSTWPPPAAPRIHRLASAHTTNLRNQLEIADTWWTDKLPNRPASWDGHKTGFIFFEEVTTYAFLYLSEQGRAQDFIRALKALFVDLQRRRPGAHVRRIRGDMDSAYSHQGDINSPLTHELHEFLSQHPGLSIVPVAPHAHELNRAENPMGLNVEGGRSQGEFFCCYPGSGALCWSSSAPASSADSSSAPELHQATRCAKAVAGLRILHRELWMPPSHPTITYTDSQVVIDATKSEKVSKESKWVCTRLAMTRYYQTSGTGTFTHIAGTLNLSDMLTKPHATGPFKEHRAVALGLIPRAPGGNQ